MRLLLTLIISLLSFGANAGAPVVATSWISNPGNDYCMYRIRFAGTNFSADNGTWLKSTTPYPATINPANSSQKRCEFDWSDVFQASTLYNRAVLVEVTFSNLPNVPSQNKWGKLAVCTLGSGTLQWVCTSTQRYGWMKSTRYGWSYPGASGNFLW